MLNAILMPYVLKANQSAIDDRIGRLARYLELEPDFDAFLNWVLSLREQISIPHALSAIIPEDSRLSEIGEMAVVDPSAGSNPILHDAKTYAEIARSAYNGNL
jgi:alcohol dehydrogenase class IV